MMLLEFTLALALDPLSLEAADSAADANDFTQAAEICIELAMQEEVEVEALIRQDAVFSAIVYAIMASEKDGSTPLQDGSTPLQDGSTPLLCRAYATLIEYGRGDVLDVAMPRIKRRLESLAGPSWRSSCSSVKDVPPRPSLEAADRAADANDFVRATEICIELAMQDEVELEALPRQDAVFSAVVYAIMASEQDASTPLLCRAYTTLLEYGRGDVLDVATPRIKRRLESLAGPSWHSVCFPVKEVPPAPAPTQAPSPEEAPASPLTEPAPRADAGAFRTPGSRPLMIAGTTLVSLGAASLAGMTAALIVWDQNVDAIDGHEAAVEQGAKKTAVRDYEVTQLVDSAASLESLAITTGVLGAVTVITGAALLIAGHKRSRELSVIPTLTPTFSGVTLSARF